LFAFFLLIPLSHRDFRSLLIPGNKRDELAKFAEWSKLVVDYLCGKMTYFTGLLGHQTFLATAGINSSKLFIAPSLQARDAMTSQPKRLLPCGR